MDMRIGTRLVSISLENESKGLARLAIALNVLFLFGFQSQSVARLQLCV